MRSQPKGVAATVAEIWSAIKEMPPTMRSLWWMKLFQWYGMMCYWIYIVPSLAKTLYGTSDATSTGFRDAGLLNGKIGGSPMLLPRGKRKYIIQRWLMYGNLSLPLASNLGYCSIFAAVHLLRQAGC